MSGQIKVGDLVQIVKPRSCCGNDSGVGFIFTVQGFRDSCTCDECGPKPGPHAIVTEIYAVEVQRLKRIPPLDELERDEIVKELTA